MIDVTDCLQEITEHVCRNVGEFSHIDPQALLLCFAKSRKRSLRGVYAKIFPTRFPGGKASIKHRGREFAYPTIEIGERRILYVLYFYFPRFQNLRFETKLLTLFHELYHISPEFDGDIRRFPGKNYAHGHSRRAFDERLKAMIDGYISRFADEEILDFLRMDFDQLRERYGRITGTTMKMPRVHAVV
ncbi:hypothetical protein J7M28_12035 [bacterium]|nr:hypothetical protein [bacterium]